MSSSAVLREVTFGLLVVEPGAVLVCGRISAVVPWHAHEHVEGHEQEQQTTESGGLLLADGDAGVGGVVYVVPGLAIDVLGVPQGRAHEVVVVVVGIEEVPRVVAAGAGLGRGAANGRGAAEGGGG